MAKQTVNLGTSPSGAGGDTFRSSASKFQANDNELYAALGGSSGTLPVALPIVNGGTGATTASVARTNLGLGTAATQDRSRTFIGVGPSLAGSAYTSASNDGQYVMASSISEPSNPNLGVVGYFIPLNDLGSNTGTRYRLFYGAHKDGVQFQYSTNIGSTWSPWYFHRTTANTTVDANGFIKAASPIVQLYADKIELNDEAQQQPITFEKLDVGQYLIKGSTGFALEGWYVETPKDANGNVLFSVIYDTLENGDISVKTYKKKFDLETASIVADLSQPVDITPGRWIDLRLQEIPVEELELVESSTPPDFQPTNLSQAVAEAMVTYDDTEQ